MPLAGFNLKKLYELHIAEKKAERRSRPCRPLRMTPVLETSLRNTSNTDWGMRKYPALFCMLDAQRQLLQSYVR